MGAITFRQRLNKFKKRANISYAKIYYATRISENHIKKTVAGKVNVGILHIESYAKLFGVEDYEMLNYNAPIPSREDLQDNIQAHFASIGYTSSENFKKLGPSYIVEEFIEELGAFSEPLEAVQLKDLCNATKGTSYNTNDVARVLKTAAAIQVLLAPIGSTALVVVQGKGVPPGITGIVVCGNPSCGFAYPVA